MDGDILSRNEIASIVSDTVTGNLKGSEITAFLISTYVNGLNMDETEYLSREMAYSGEVIKFDNGPIIDHHSIGGVPGNKVTLLLAPIIAAAGFKIPKTCSRAISGAGGTADIMEAAANVSFTAKEIKDMTNEVGGVIVWGDGSDFSHVDSIFINYQKDFRVDPRNIMIASILSKKLAAGATHLIMDIPVGFGTKVLTQEEGNKLALDFAEIGKRLGIKITTAITHGGAPIGRTIGVNLEFAEALSALENKENTSFSLREKSVSLSGLGLEFVGAVPKGDGITVATKLISSGKALKKMKEIIEIQGGDPNIKSDDIVPGDFSIDINAPIDGFISSVSNQGFIDIARAAGCPKVHGSGLYLDKKPGKTVKKGEKLYTIYAEKEWQLSNALKIAEKERPMVVSSMVLNTL